MKLKMQGSGTVDVAESAFGAEFNEALVHQVVTAYLAGSRAGTKAQKNRSQASGGGAKPWRQKGTGRARAGTIRSPIWVGGGRTFAAQPRDYSQKVNKKMYRAALRSVMSELVRQDRLIITDSVAMKAPKTKELAGKLKKLGLDNVLIVNEADLITHDLCHILHASIRQGDRCLGRPVCGPQRAREKPGYSVDLKKEHAKRIEEV